MVFGKNKKQKQQNQSVALSPVQAQDEFSSQIYNNQIQQPEQVQQPVQQFQQNQPMQMQPVQQQQFQQPEQVQSIQQIQERPVQQVQKEKCLIISKELLSDGEYKYTIVTTDSDLDIGYCNLTQGV